ncbi:hypothetical protein HDU91_004256 [Kappamyces sp. JEL0680]|nr:hypothetical protein HDU91_004256 [Kappamyces sp. JEL0680]
MAARTDAVWLLLLRSASPIFPGVVKVVFGKEAFSSKLTVVKAVASGEVVAAITQHTFKEKKSWTTVQVAQDKHIELNSELVYMNHSCDPSVKIDCVSMQVVALRALQAGDEVTFFYPSTEWDMDQPFSCWCGAKACQKSIQGAKYLASNARDCFYLAPHIRDLIRQSSESGAA